MQRAPVLTGKELDVGPVVALIKSAAARYDVVSWSTNSPNEIEVVWIQRSPLKSSELSKSKSCEQNGISTCGIEFCSDDMPPSDCVTPNMMLFLNTLIAICRRRVSMRIHMGRSICKGFHHSSGANSSDLLVVRENPSLLKLLQYGKRSCVTRTHKIFMSSSGKWHDQQLLQRNRDGVLSLDAFNEGTIVHESEHGAGLGNLVLSLSTIFVTALYSEKMFFTGYSPAAAVRYSGHFSSAIAAHIDAGVLVNSSAHSSRVRPSAKNWTVCGRWKEESDGVFVDFSDANFMLPHVARINAHVSFNRVYVLANN